LAETTGMKSFLLCRLNSGWAVNPQHKLIVTHLSANKITELRSGLGVRVWEMEAIEHRLTALATRETVAVRAVCSRASAEYPRASLRACAVLSAHGMRQPGRSVVVRRTTTPRT
jgi:hypothetical protein